MENAVKPTLKKSSTIFDTIIGYFIFALILIALIWNWDGFWQTNIGPLKETLIYSSPATDIGTIC